MTGVQTCALPILGNKGTGPLADRLLAMANREISPRVRYQLAFTLGDVRSPARPRVLADLIAHDADSPWMRAAVLSSLADGGGEVFAYLVRDVRFRGQPGSEEFLRQLAEMIGARNSYAEAKPVLEFVAKPDPSAPVATWIRALGDGAVRAGTTLAALDKFSHLKGTLTAAAQTVDTVRVGNDALPADNAFNFVVSPAVPVRVIVVSSTTGSNLYLSRALAVGDAPKFDVDLRQADNISDTDLQRASVVLLNDVQVNAALGRRQIGRAHV